MSCQIKLGWNTVLQFLKCICPEPTNRKWPKEVISLNLECFSLHWVFYVELNICLFIAFQIKGFVIFKVATISLWPRRSCGSSCSSEYWGTFHTDDSEHFPFCWQRWNECDFGYSKVRNPCSQWVLCYFWHFNFFFFTILAGVCDLESKWSFSLNVNCTCLEIS